MPAAPPSLINKNLIMKQNCGMHRVCRYFAAPVSMPRPRKARSDAELRSEWAFCLSRNPFYCSGVFMGRSSMNRFILIVLLVLAAVGANELRKTEAFQKAVFPKDYWQKKVTSYEDVIASNEFMIRIAYRALQRTQLTATLDIAESVDLAERCGQSKEAARDKSAKKISASIEDYNASIKVSLEVNEKLKQELQAARMELSKYK